MAPEPAAPTSVQPPALSHIGAATYCNLVSAPIVDVALPISALMRRRTTSPSLTGVVVAEIGVFSGTSIATPLDHGSFGV